MKYLIEKDKYFVYPYRSQSTNFGDKGTHFSGSTDMYQVPLDMADNPTFKFCRFEESSSIYDIYCENTNLFKELNIAQEQLTTDIYGTKKPDLSTRYLLTNQSIHYKLLKSYDSALRPHELHVIEDILGTKLFIYNKTCEAERVL